MNRVLVVLLLAGSAFSQTKAPLVDCGKVTSSPACKSFNQMLEKGDRDLVDAISGANQAVVCFRPDEDTFVLVSYGRVEGRPFLAGPELNLERSSATVKAMVYKNQISDDLRRWTGYWQKQAGQPKNQAVFASSNEDEGKVRIDPSGLLISYDFSNPDKTTTTYTLQVRRPALRAVEAFESTTRQSKPHRRSLTEQCSEFK